MRTFILFKRKKNKKIVSKKIFVCLALAILIIGLQYSGFAQKIEQAKIATQQQADKEDFKQKEIVLNQQKLNQKKKIAANDFSDRKQELSPLNAVKWEKGGIFEGFSPEQEDISLRTQNSKKFRNYDGSITAQIGGNYHYADDFGKWQDIDFTITKSNYNGYAYENITNTIKTYFPETAGSKGVSISDKSMDIKIWKNPELLIYDANKNILHKESSLNNSAKVKDNIAQY